MIALKKSNTVTKPVILFIFLLIYILIIYFGGPLKKTATEGIKLCVDSIIPSLFPVMTISSVIINLGFPAIKEKGRCIKQKKRYNNCRFALSLFVFGLTGGYPIAAKTAYELYSSGKISDKAAKIAALTLLSPGLGYAVIITGGMFGSVKTGFFMFFSIIMSDMILYFIYRLFSIKKPSITKNLTDKSSSFSETIVNSVNSSVTAVFNICAWIILFNVLAKILMLTLRLSENSLFYMFFEITSATAISAKSGDIQSAVFFSAFGGFCVLFQLLPYLKELKISVLEYIFTRLCAGMGAWFIFKLIYCIFPEASACFYQTIDIRLYNNTPTGTAALLFYGVFIIYSVSNIFFGQQKTTQKNNNIHF